jgi:predicted AlkP superfamily phosphohydrolase/phosphomutase
VARVKTLSEAETARRRAVTGLRNFGRDDDADRIDALSTREYAAERGFEIIGENTNPHRRMNMPRKSMADVIADLKDQVADLESENEELQGRLDDISEVISGPDEDDEDDEEEEEADDED